MLADNLVFLTNSPDPLTLDRDVLYSILDKHPKRAKAYWFINVHVTDEPYTHEYSVETFGTDFCSACAWTWALRSTSALTPTCARLLAT